MTKELDTFEKYLIEEFYDDYGPAPDLDQVPNIQAAVLGVYAEQDERINADIDVLDPALSAAGITYEMNIYPGVNHVFHNDTSGRYVEEQATQARQDTLAWFAKYVYKQLLPLSVLLFVCILLTACVNVVESEVGIAPTVDQQDLAREDDTTEENETTAGSGSTDDSTTIADTLIQLSEPLDEPEYYCIDVPGFGQSLNLDGALTAHTCKPNSDDELFTVNYPSEGQFYMPAYERCMEARTAEAGAELTMTACSDSPLQQFTHHDDGSIQLQSSDSETLCIAVADEAGEPTGGPSHLMRDLLLQPCATVSTTLSQWVFPGREVK